MGFSYFRSLMFAMKKCTVSLVGSGNIATHLGTKLFSVGYPIESVFSRNHHNASILAKKLNAKAVTSVKDMAESDVIILAVPDGVIETTAAAIPSGESILLHVSGSTEMNVLKPFAKKFGVFYPLQTFSKFKEVDFSEIPICIEANDEKVYRMLESLGASISNDVRNINSEQRLAIHLAAVFTSNFVNYMNIEAAYILDKHQVRRDIILPLLKETLQKSLAHHPYDAQTGPAIRKDYKTLDKHLEKLEEFPDIQKVYKLLTEQIIKKFEK